MQRFSRNGLHLKVYQGDITKADTVAIANAANAMLMGGGGVDGAIHRAAGPELLDALREAKKDLPGGMLATGGSVMTPGFRRRARQVIHCVGPIYEREGSAAPDLLAACYTSAVSLCFKQAIRSIAFPSISTGVYGYPVNEAAPIAVRAVVERADHLDMDLECHFVLFDEQTLEAYETAAKNLF
jgi:O-acetyl-ADP-ribose deacetylase (regulator of RNase III)